MPMPVTPGDEAWTIVAMESSPEQDQKEKLQHDHHQRTPVGA